MSVPWKTTPVPADWRYKLGDTVTINGNKQGFKVTGTIVDYESSSCRVIIQTENSEGYWYATHKELEVLNVR